MEAKKMFSRLGYTKTTHNDNPYVVTFKKPVPGDNIFIQFSIERKQVSKFYMINNSTSSITVDELKAINQQLKELGWLDGD